MLITTIFFMLFFSLIFPQDSNRYTDSLFNFNQKITDGIYANAPELTKPYQGENSTHKEDLKFHLFTPKNDTLELRPLIICIHGGGFISGNKEHDDMIEFCKLFAKKGYVTATIQYRLGMNVLSKISSERAVYRSLQDGRAAIRFFKKNAKNYGIDTNYIYLLGSSAGAFVALHNLFLNNESERPTSTFQISNNIPISNNGPDLDSLDAINPTLNYGSHPNGVISLWGAIQNTELIKASDGTIPLLLVHGTSDSTVPFNIGHPFGIPTLPETYGSKPINERLISLGFNKNTYFVPNENHEFYGVSNGMWNPAPNNYWDTVVTKSTNFLWDIHKPIAKFGYEDENYGQTFYFKDSSVGATKWEWDFGDGSKSIEQNPVYEYYSWGRYKVVLKILNSIDSWDTTSTLVDYLHVGVNDEENIPLIFKLSQNYPNPFNPTTVINYSIAKSVDANFTSTINVVLKVYNLLGQEIAILVNKEQTPGKYKVTFDASNYSNGVYIYRINAGNYHDSKKLILLR